MIIISFDIGIKNMGYCIFKTFNDTESENPFTILDWGILKLIEPKNTIVNLCNCYNIGKRKKDISIECKKPAKYAKSGENGEGPKYYCKKHANLSETPIIANMKSMLSKIKKSTKEIIIQKCNEFNLNLTDTTDKKSNIFELLESHIKNKCIHPIEITKEVSANDIDLIFIGKQMKVVLDMNPFIDQITHVIIENQISPIANRMKTIQGMLAQYFIMKNTDVDIEFISSANKLKQFSNIEQYEILHAETDNVKTKYKEHKKDGIFYCDEILSKNDWLSEWIPKINIKKKDDLADSFLQGLWILKKKGHIQYLDNLVITKI